LTLGADGSKRALINKLWNHPKLQEKFGKARGHIIFDGSKLAWSIVELPIQDQLTMVIDLDDGKFDVSVPTVIALTPLKTNPRGLR
jgi:eukaryotic translation initiation factor 2C